MCGSSAYVVRGWQVRASSFLRSLVWPPETAEVWCAESGSTLGGSPMAGLKPDPSNARTSMGAHGEKLTMVHGFIGQTVSRYVVRPASRPEEITFELRASGGCRGCEIRMLGLRAGFWHLLEWHLLERHLVISPWNTPETQVRSLAKLGCCPTCWHRPAECHNNLRCAG